MQELVAAGDRAASRILRLLGPLVPPARESRFHALAARWALCQGRVPLAVRLAPRDEEVRQRAATATLLRLLYTAWRRAEALGLAGADSARERLLEPSFLPDITPALALSLAASLHASGRDAEAAALLDPATDPRAGELLQSWLTG